MTGKGGCVAFEHVSKRYVWRHGRPRSFLELLAGFAEPREGAREFWALRDLTLQVGPGEAVGLIGPNGAGKSTALKLASRVIEPTEGRVTVNGRVSALLELAAGFHPDLTGRENVFLSGALMGLSMREMQQRYDEIVDFAGVGDFIDSPVRHYSSGMAMRLGFAVASSVCPDVLLIDEVLAVGDRAFSQRCLDKIYGLKERGTAMLFVSHDLEAVRNLCDLAALLIRGQVREIGNPDHVIACYLQELAESSGDMAQASLLERQERWGSGELRITDVWIEDSSGSPAAGVSSGEALSIVMRYAARQEVGQPVFGLAIKDQSGYLLSGPNTRFHGLSLGLVSGSGEMRYHVSSVPLQPGRYFLSVSAYDTNLVHAYDHWEHCLSFEIFPGAGRPDFGVVLMQGSWEWSGQKGRGDC